MIFDLGLRVLIAIQVVILVITAGYWYSRWRL